uniref:Ig-like domain-containing protein n=1 Tax=Poecilia latipinna TaxID=48699 RepID=A0A3B3UTS8_9TELE
MSLMALWKKFTRFCFSLSAVNFQQLPSVFVKVGDQSVTLWCDQDNNQNYYMFWYRHPADSGKMELVAYSVGKDAAAIEAPFSKTKYTLTRPEVLRTSLQIHSPEAADSAVYYCASSLAQSEAYFGAGTKLTVLDAEVQPPTVKILEPSKKECKDKKGKKKKTLVCVASDFYPDHVSVSWTRNGQNITDDIQVSTDAAATAKKDGKNYKITSRLMVPIKDWVEPNINFTCTVSFFNGKSNIKKNTTYTSTFISETNILNCSLYYIKITQNAKISYTVLILKSCLYAALVCFLVWKLQVGPETSMLVLIVELLMLRDFF